MRWLPLERGMEVQVPVSALRLWFTVLLAGVVSMMIPIFGMFRAVTGPQLAIGVAEMTRSALPEEVPTPDPSGSDDSTAAIAVSKIAGERVVTAALGVAEGVRPSLPADIPAPNPSASGDSTVTIATSKISNERLVTSALAAIPVGPVADFPARRFAASDIITVEDATTIRTRLVTISLAGLEKLPKNSVCLADEGLWACGRQAQVALYNLVHGHDLDCGPGERVPGAAIVASCKIAGRDIGVTQVSNGWARPADPSALQVEVAAAHREVLGLWRGGWTLRPQVLDQPVQDGPR
jgi:endonuclease YncB( thermonuclease family)